MPVSGGFNSFFYTAMLQQQIFGLLVIFQCQSLHYHLHSTVNQFYITKLHVHHLLKYKERDQLPVHFTGSIAFGFKDVLQELCNHYGLKLGRVMKTPLQGLIQYHL